MVCYCLTLWWLPLPFACFGQSESFTPEVDGSHCGLVRSEYLWYIMWFLIILFQFPGVASLLYGSYSFFLGECLPMIGSGGCRMWGFTTSPASSLGSYRFGG